MDQSEDDSVDLSSKEGRFRYCTSKIEVAVRELGQEGLEATDIFDALAGLVVSSFVMNDVPKEQSLQYISEMFDRAWDQADTAELIMHDRDRNEES
jgi:hypothetical protein